MSTKTFLIAGSSAKIRHYLTGRPVLLTTTCGLHFHREGDYFSSSNSKSSSLNSSLSTRPLQLRRQSSEAYKATSLPALMSNNFKLVVIGTGAPGSPASFYLSGYGSAFLVNCGESVQRILTEHNIRMKTLKRIICTSKDWRNIGGLLGMCLTLQNAGLKEIAIHGNPACLQMARLNVALSDHRFLASQLHHYDPKVVGWYEDTRFLIKEMELNPYHTAGANSNDVLDEPHPHVNHVCRSTTLYAFYLKPAPPRIDFVRCVELGVPAGALIKQLNDHLHDPTFTVTLPNGRVVKLSDIIVPQVDLRPLLVFECPSLPFLRRLLSQINLKNGGESTRGLHPFAELCGSEPALVAHITRFPIAHCEEYQQFMASFPETTRHLVLDGSCTDPPNLAPHNNQAILHLAHPRVFPLLPLYNTQSPTDSGDLASDRIVYARPGLIYDVRPPRFSDDSRVPVAAEKIASDALAASEKLKSEVESLTQLRARTRSSDDQHNYPQFVFLGTGSTMPNKTRNVSAFLVQADSKKWLLFDCGEGTYAQLVAHFGPDTDDVLRHLRAIFISHMHADHHTGVFTILNERRRAIRADRQSTVSPSSGLRQYPSPYSFNHSTRKYNKPNDGPRLVLLAPKQFASWLNTYIDIIQDRDNSLLQDVELINANQINPYDVARPNSSIIRQVTETERPQPAEFDLWTTKTFKNLNLKHLFATCGVNSVFAVPVTHFGKCYGYVIVLRNGIKMVYSGDTMPCQKLVEAGQDCDVLVHEATLDDDMYIDAKMKRHSTVSQAIDVARQMRARHCILTHFSQRYVDIPPAYAENTLLAPSRDDKMKIGVAFDHMCLTLADIDFSRHLFPFLKSAYPDSYDLLVSIFNKRQNKRLRTLDGFQ